MANDATNAQLLCLENAEGLVEDAKVLYNNGRFPRALAMCVLSFEEMGKIVQLTGALVNKTPNEWERFWKRFRDHKSKRKIVASIEADMWGLTDDERRDEQQTEEFVERMKLLCLYVDFVNGKKVYTPMGSFGTEIEKIASNAIRFAEGRLGMFAQIVRGLSPEVRVAIAEEIQEILSKKTKNPDSLREELLQFVNRLKQKDGS